VSKRILIVDDEEIVVRSCLRILSSDEYKVDVANNGLDALTKIAEQDYDMLILDIMMPKMNGMEVLQRVKESHPDIDVIMITGLNEIDTAVKAMKLGAFDYLPKPFFVEELIARIIAVSRRASGEQLSVIHHGGITLNLITREVKRGEETLELTSREFNLLELLMRSPGRVYSRTQLLEHVWGYDFDPQTNVVDVYIRRVRGKVDAPENPSPIETVRGVGYRFKADA